VETLEARQLLTSVPFGATPTDTAEYMLGDVHVSVVFLESSVTSQNTETWHANSIAAAKNKVEVGLQWWVDALAVYHPEAYLQFHVDFTHADQPFVVNYEPVNRTSDAHVDFVNDFLNAQGFTAALGTLHDRVYAFNHAQRVEAGTDWSFTIFVVNDENDLDKQFAPGGSFSRAFAYPGGRYLVTLADRPASTITHEVGHIFWAFDEYNVGGDSHYARRGYYNAQNLNGANGAPAGFVQQPSIMASGTLLATSYNTHFLPESTRAIIGWRDADGDGIIDLLDVPHALTGRGFIDPLTGDYRFIGASQVRTFFNQNSAGNRNDITINRIHVAEYSFDGATWHVAEQYDSASVSLDLTIALDGQSEIMIRTRDARTGVVSDVFVAPTHRLTAFGLPGIQGVVYNDANGNGVWDVGELTLANRTVYLVDPQGQPLPGPKVLDPDDYPSNTQSLSYVEPAVVLTTWGSDAGSSSVFSRLALHGQTESRMFAGRSAISGQTNTFWTEQKQLRIDFETPTHQVALDAVGTSLNGSFGRLEIYNAQGVLIGRYTTSQLALGAIETMTVASAEPIAYAIARAHQKTTVALDRLVIGVETATTTDAYGVFALPYLPAGTYAVRANTPENWDATAPASTTREVTVGVGQVVVDVNFGQQRAQAGWQNSENRFDVNGDGLVTPLDALLIIIDMNANGMRVLGELPSGEFPPAMVDVNGDGILTPLDALEVIIYLNSGAIAGQGESPAGATPPPAGEDSLPPGSGEEAFGGVVSASWNLAGDAQAIRSQAPSSPHDLLFMEEKGDVGGLADPENWLVSLGSFPAALRSASARVPADGEGWLLDDLAVDVAAARLRKSLPAQAGSGGLEVADVTPPRATSWRR
jgi:hypothetical protein